MCPDHSVLCLFLPKEVTSRLKPLKFRKLSPEGWQDGLFPAWLLQERTLDKTAPRTCSSSNSSSSKTQEAASSPAHIYSGTGATLSTWLALIDRALLSCLLSLGIIRVLNKVIEFAMLCPTSAMCLHLFLRSFPKINLKENYETWLIPRSSCPSFMSLQICWNNISRGFQPARWQNLWKVIAHWRC